MYRLRAHLHFCYSGDRAIFLDAACGRYFCLPAKGETAFLAFQNGRASDDQIDWLKSQNILAEPSDRQGLNSPVMDRIPEPSEELEFTGRATAFEIGQATLMRLAVQLLLKYRGFGWAYRSLIANKAKRGSIPRIDGEPAAAVIAAAFHTTDLLLGKTDRCLPRSLAFLRLCNARGHFPSLVIGVRTNPFTAHAWVQIGSKVLNDSVDRAKAFTPILVL